MTTVTSAQNPIVRALRALQTAKGREEAGLFLAEGPKLCGEALRDATVETVLVAEAYVDVMEPLLQQARDVVVAPEHVFRRVGEARTPQGILASVRMPAPLDLDDTARSLLVLDGVQDPGNVGTMLRTAEAAGFCGALLSPQCADVYAPKTVRATMGSVFRLPVWRGSLPQALATLAGRGYTMVATAADAAPFQAARHRIRKPVALLIGSEGNGISEEVVALADALVALPMRGRAESLNAAVAAGIMMYGLMDDT